MDARSSESTAVCAALPETPRRELAARLALAELEARELARVALLALWLLAGRGPRALRRWHGRARQRAQLAELSPHLLRDIGVTHRQRAEECRKWFWQP
jgi:uncharacterized protein YjiS (DUF1127 family)